MARKWWTASSTIALIALVALVGCGGDDDETEVQAPAADPTDTADTADQTFPVTIDAANGEVTIEAPPERIVSLAPTATEMLFAIGAGDQVEAVDSFSNYPPDAPITDLSAF
jgi:iron complex transport system substrate-binding protein